MTRLIEPGPGRREGLPASTTFGERCDSFYSKGDWINRPQITGPRVAAPASKTTSPADPHEPWSEGHRARSMAVTGVDPLIATMKSFRATMGTGRPALTIRSAWPVSNQCEGEPYDDR
jgi:hypothetical protein